MAGNYAAALDLDTEMLEVCERLEDEAGIAGACGSIARTHLVTGDVENAIPWLSRSFRLWCDIGDIVVVGMELDVIALVACLRGDARPAGLLLGAADAAFDGVGEARNRFAAPFYDWAAETTAEALGEDARVCGCTCRGQRARSRRRHRDGPSRSCSG